ncbi:conserved hypothetical protein [Yersinia enterocolitica (type O:5) str. YE53/03]|nr:conserved hypothetical protein [Yersinia enterocolitica (type O:5) str. YE53/03]
MHSLGCYLSLRGSLMVKSMIGLLRKNQSFIQATRCYEGINSDSQIPVLPSSCAVNILSSPVFPSLVSTSRNNSPCDIVSLRLLNRMSTLFAFSLAIIGCKGSQNRICM